MRVLLTDPRFGFAEQDIVSLAGWPAKKAHRPTRDNIEGAFQDLAQAAGPGDQVVILLAGHGSRQPADDDPDDPEPDRYDEIFLPSDVESWNGMLGRVENAIADDELRIWIDAIRSRGASVWLIADACHSGTLVRSGGGERMRQVPLQALIPSDVLAA